MEEMPFRGIIYFPRQVTFWRNLLIKEIIPERRTRAAVSENSNNDYCQFHGYLQKGNLQDAIESCHQEFVNTISSLKESLAFRLESILENDVFKAVSVILDSESYQFLESDIVYDEVKVVVVDYFESTLLANNCNLNSLK